MSGTYDGWHLSYFMDSLAMHAKFHAWEGALWSDAPNVASALKSSDPNRALDAWARHCKCIYGGEITHHPVLFATFDGVSPPLDGLPVHPKAKVTFTLNELGAELKVHTTMLTQLLRDLREPQLRERLTQTASGGNASAVRSAVRAMLTSTMSREAGSSAEARKWRVADDRQIFRIGDTAGRILAVEREIAARGRRLSGGPVAAPVLYSHALVVDESTNTTWVHVRDVDVEFFLHHGAEGIVRYLHSPRVAPHERWVAGIIRRTVIEAQSPGRPPLLVLDIGANAGYYGMLALAHNASVAFFDAQPSCWRFIHAALRKNGFGADRAQLVRAAVSTSPHEERIALQVGAARHACDGHFGQRGRANFTTANVPANSAPHLAATDTADATRAAARSVLTSERSEIDDGGRTPNAASSTVRALPLTGAFRDGGLVGAALSASSHVELIIKMDTEGAEIGILNGTILPLIEARRVRHLVFEASPGYWSDKVGASTALAAGLAARIVLAGYVLHTQRKGTFRTSETVGAYVKGICRTCQEDLWFERSE